MVKDSSLKGNVSGVGEVVTGVGVVLENTFRRRDLREGSLVRIEWVVGLGEEERDGTSLLLENLERFLKKEFFLEKERTVAILLGV